MTDLPPPNFDESALLDLDPSAAAAVADDLPFDVRFHLRAEITPVQGAFLDRTGFLVFDRVASTDEVAAILAEVDRIEADLIARDVRTLFGVPIWFGWNPDGVCWLQRMGFTSVLSSYLSAFVKHERFEPVRRLIGQDARIGEREKDGVVFNRYVNAPGSLRPNLAWHTDALRDVFYNRRMPGPMLNVGLHFDRITPKDGCLILLPGTHTQSVFSTLFRKIHFVTNKPDPNEVKVETWPGDLTVHDGRMWHRVQTSPHVGWRSLRRSMYVPYVIDAYQPKDEHTRTNLYMRLFDWIIRRRARRMEKQLTAGRSLTQRAGNGRP
jgi:hypothetical protein